MSNRRKPRMQHQVTGVQAVYPKPTSDGKGYNVVVLDRIEAGVTPDYCIHGRVTCMGTCNEWLWLGDHTHELVKSGEVVPLCLECAIQMLPADAVPVRNANDHRRADGPH